MEHFALTRAGRFALLAGLMLAPRPARACVTVTSQSKLVAADAEPSDEFGRSVAIDGPLALVGAYGDDEAGDSSGAAYLFEQDAAGDWNQVARLTASDAGTWQRFGGSVSLSGSRALVGSSGFGTGRAYLFEPDAGGTWGQVAELVPDDFPAPAGFGGSLSLQLDRAIVSAPGDDHAGVSSGSAYLFEREADGSWPQVARLTADDAVAVHMFGRSVTLSGDTAMVGAPGDADAGSRSGAVYVFERDGGGAWLQVAKLTADDAAEQAWFGASVSVSGNLAIVGSYGDDEPSGPTTGSAYVFERDADGTWVQVAKLGAQDAAAGDQFAFAVALSGERAILGALGDADAGRDSGSAYLFERDGSGRWSQSAKLTADDAAMDDAFGVSVAVAGNRAIVGSMGDDEASGSAHVFESQCLAEVRRGWSPDVLFRRALVDGSTWTDALADFPLLFYRVSDPPATVLFVTRSPDGIGLSW